MFVSSSRMKKGVDNTSNVIDISKYRDEGKCKCSFFHAGALDNYVRDEKRLTKQWFIKLITMNNY